MHFSKRALSVQRHSVTRTAQWCALLPPNERLRAAPAHATACRTCSQ
jgi:hypothetical protein